MQNMNCYFSFPLPEIELLKVILDIFFFKFVIICYLFHLSVPLFKVFGNIMFGLTLQPYTFLHSSSKWVTASDCSLERNIFQSTATTNIYNLNFTDHIKF